MILGPVIKDAANRNGISCHLLAAIAWHETVAEITGHDLFLAQYLVRYKPLKKPNFLTPFLNFFRASTSADSVREAHDQATYWGFCQVRGKDARTLGFAGASLVQLCDPQTNFEFGARKLARCLQTARKDLATALSIYKGVTDSDYATKVLEVIETEAYATLLQTYEIGAI